MQYRRGKSRKQVWAALAACALSFGLFAGTAPVQAADPVNVGVLDEMKLGEGYVKYRTAVDELTQYAQKLEARLQAREVLNATEAKKFDELIGKSKPSSEESAELEALVKAGGERRRKYTELAGKAERSAEEDQFLKDVQADIKTNEEAVNRLEDTMFEELKARERETDKEYIDKANREVQKVATDKKLTAVLRKDAVAWFAPTVDITDEVLKRLNK